MKLRRTPDIDSIVMLKLFQHLSCRLVLASLDSRTVRRGTPITHAPDNRFDQS